MIARAVIPDEGSPTELLTLLGKQPFGAVPWQLLLFSNNVDPTHLTVFGDLTEVTGGGYSRTTLDPAQWQTPILDNGIATSLWSTAAVVFRPSAAVTWNVYGWAFCDAATNQLRLVYQAVAGGSPIVVTNLHPLVILPSYSLTTDTCSP